MQKILFLIMYIMFSSFYIFSANDADIPEGTLYKCKFIYEGMNVRYDTQEAGGIFVKSACYSNIDLIKRHPPLRDVVFNTDFKDKHENNYMGVIIYGIKKANNADALPSYFSRSFRGTDKRSLIWSTRKIGLRCSGEKHEVIGRGDRNGHTEDLFYEHFSGLGKANIENLLKDKIANNETLMLWGLKFYSRSACCDMCYQYTLPEFKKYIDTEGLFAGTPFVMIYHSRYSDRGIFDFKKEGKIFRTAQFDRKKVIELLPPGLIEEEINEEVNEEQAAIESDVESEGEDEVIPELEAVSEQIPFHINEITIQPEKSYIIFKINDGTATKKVTY